MFVQRRIGNSSLSSDPGERYIRVPEHGLSNSSYEMSAASMPSFPLLLNVAAGEYPSVFPVPSAVTSVKESGGDNGESYIRLEECYSGQPVGTSGTLPLFSTSHDVSPYKASNPVRPLAATDADADHKVEYCNDYELGEHDSVFVSGNSRCNCTVGAAGGSKCATHDDDDDNDDVDYCHYKYPVVRYSVQSVSSELTESRSVKPSGCLFREPLYVNCIDWNLNRYSAKRHGICCDLVLTYPEEPKLLLEQPLSLSTREHHTVGTCSTDSWESCRFFPCPSTTSTSKACASDIDDDDDDGADAHNYVNVPPLRDAAQFCPPAHKLSVGAAFTASGRYPDFIDMETVWRK